MRTGRLPATTLLAAALAAATPAVAGGLEVFSVDRSSKATAAGICPGDVLSSWWAARPERLPPGTARRGPLDSAFALDELSREQGYATPVVLEGERAGEPVRFLLTPGEWGVTTLPLRSEDFAGRFAGAAALFETGRAAAGAEALRDLACSAMGDGLPQVACWLYLQAGTRLSDARRYADAAACLDEALEATGQAASPFARARLGFAKALALRAAKEYEGSARAYRNAIALREPLAPDTFLASIANSFGAMEDERGRGAEAEELWSASLAAATAACPGSLAVADACNNLGNCARKRRDLAEAERLYRSSLALREELSPASSATAQTLNNFAIILSSRGDFAGAEANYRRCLGILERTSPGSRFLATALNNLGTITLQRGDLAATEDAYRRAIEILEAEGPPSAFLAATYQNMGGVAQERRDFEAARTFYEKALSIKEKLPKDDLSMAITLSNLGTLAEERGDLERAEALYRRSLDLREARAPLSMDVAEGLENLGTVAFLRGDFERAESYHLRSLEIREKVAPGGLRVALSLYNLARLASKRGDASVAKDLIERSVGIYARLAPGSNHLAEALHERAAIRESAGDEERSRADLAAAVAALETQRGRLGGGASGGERFSARYAPFYRELVRAQVRAGEQDDAFSTLERFRARALLAMLAERDVDFSRDAPPELLLERRRADREYDRIQGLLADLDPAKDAAQLERLDRDLRETSLRRQDLEARIRAASPRLASLEAPRILDRRGAAEAIGAGTLFLSYCAGSESVLIFALLDGSLEVKEIAVSGAELGRWIRRFREVLADPSAPDDLREPASRLARDLLNPVAHLFPRARSLVVCPDGPLHGLPFAALPSPSGRYLIEELPVSTVLSATVLAELGSGPGGLGGGRIAAFADPEPPAGGGGPTGRGAPGPLPGSRREVEVLSRVFPRRTDAFVGPRATEERAKAVGPDTSIIHFACHARLDSGRPLDSALLLAAPEDPAGGSENGLLQAWEVLESLRLRADLVTLSACETGLGEEMGGEGIVGLTRAFHYAGARSVLSSLWMISDRSTVPLMGSFYRNLARGRAPAEALRAAQSEMIRTAGSPSDDLSHPFHWAAFVLSGPSR